MSDSQYVIFPPAPHSGIGVLAVYPPNPLGYKEQEDGSLGINIAMVYSDTEGLWCYLPEYLGQAIGDLIEVFLDTPDVPAPLPVVSFKLTEDDFEADGLTPKPVTFYIPAETLEEKFAPLTDQRLDFWTEVTRKSGNTSLPSPHAQLWFKHPAPGEADIDGGKPFNQGLKLPTPSVTTVHAGTIKAGMFVTVASYFNQRAGDKAYLAFGPLQLEQTVSNPSAAIIFKLSPTQLESLKTVVTNQLVVRWSVSDVVHNNSRWSDSVVLPFLPDVALYARPRFEKADKNNVLHYEDLTGAPARIRVIGEFDTGDVIKLTVTGFTLSCEQVEHTESRTIAAFSQIEYFELENERVRNVIGGNLQARYTVNGSEPSVPDDVTVSGESLSLGAPEVTPLVEGELAVDTAKAFVKVASFWPLKQGAEVKLHWQTTDINGKLVRFTWGQIVTDPTKTIVFEVASEFIKPYASANLAVQASITNPGEKEVVSNVAQLKIGDPKELVLTPPMLVSPFTNPVDPLAALPSMRVEYLDAKTEKVRLVCTPLPIGFDRFPLVELDSAKQATFLLDRQLITALHGETVRFKFNLNQDGEKIGSSAETPISFKLIADQDPRFPRPRIIGFDDGILDVKKLTSTDKLVVNHWHGQRPTQSLTLVLIGVDVNDNAVRYVMINAEASVTSAGLIRELSTRTLEVLRNLKNGTTATLIFSVRLGLRGKPVEFPHQIYQIESLVELQPVITLIKDSQNREIPHSDQTVDPNVTVEGTASTEQQVEVLVDGKPVETLTTDKDGKFSVLLKGLVVDALTVVQIRALYGDRLLSPLRSFTLRKALQVNNSAMALHGARVYAWAHSADFAGNTQIRAAVPSTGVPPITYRSSNPSVAFVDGNGKVTGLRNGNTYITVQDRFSSFSYNVDVRNIYRLDIYGGAVTHHGAVNWMNSVYGSVPLTRFFNAMYPVYGNDYYWPLSAGWILWMCDSAACGYNQGGYYVWRGGGHLCRNDLSIGNWPWCLRPVN
ncbi:Ig-like domain-containing protein [Pseudomonas granadensis]|uniref:Ig-like domain-containing protein n=1 Tax=Pseudomonas granadensis TaxID=1421430 RepID=UPI00087997F2|nr:Ig-like domain-containing protein [Pseudomonas granadensis]SDS59561.1 Ig-like domain (group 2) [Pseudomonas granadensis]